MSQRKMKAIRFAAIAMTALVVIGVFLVSFLTPRPKRYEALAGRPLLAQDEKEFVDRQVGLRFAPPEEWAMQSRSTEAPTHLPERELVKYKREEEEGPLPPAWLSVLVKDAADDMTPAKLLQNRKPPEAGWKPKGEIEADLQIGGMPAARRMYGGLLDEDGRGNKEFVCEILAVKRGKRIFEFCGTYAANDDEARRELRRALESIQFLSE